MMNDRINALGVSTLVTLLAAVLVISLMIGGCGSESSSISQPVTPTEVVDENGTPIPEVPAAPLMLFDMPDSRTLAYSPDGTRIAIGSGDTVWLYSADLQQQRALKGHSAPVRSVAWSPDGTQIASGALDNTVRVWDAATGSVVHTLSGHTNWVLSVAWSPDGTQIASGGADDSVLLWDAASGAPITSLGATRVDSVTFQFQDQTILDAISELAYAEAITAKVDAEPYELVQQVLEGGYTITVAFEDQTFVDMLLALVRDSYRVGIAVDDGALSDELATFTQDQTITLIISLDDPEIAAVIGELEAAEATITAINERPDADLLRMVRQLQRQDFVIVIQQADGESTTVNPGDANFVATIQDLAGQDVTLSVELQDQQVIFDALQDPDFVEALNQLEEASTVVATINERPDADVIRLVRQLQPLPYQITFATGDDDFDAALAALDPPTRLHLIDALHTGALMSTLDQLEREQYTISDIPGHKTAAITQALDAGPGELAYALALNVDDETLAAQVIALEPADLRHVISLLEDVIFRFQLDHYADAQDTIAQITASDDAALIAVVRGLGGPKTTEIIFSSPQNSNDVNVTRRLKAEELIFTAAPAGEAAIEALSVMQDSAIADQFRAMDAAQISDGTYTLTPALDADALVLIMPRLADLFAVTVQRENNAHTGGVTAVMWSPDSTVLASASADATVRLWDPPGGQMLATYDTHKDAITAASWAPDASQFATASWDNTVIIWETSGGADNVETVVTIKGFKKRVNALAWSPDGAKLATGTRDGSITVWDAASGEEIAIVEHFPEVLALAWSPDGSRLISSGGDGRVRLWDAAAMD